MPSEQGIDLEDGFAAVARMLGLPDFDPFAKDVPKVVALYQDRPNERQRCGRCRHFLPPNGCEIVGGISLQGWCRYFEARA
jgi:hypothetical protein